jgi:hypothetical protein
MNGIRNAPLKRPRLECDSNINMNFEGLGCEEVCRIKWQTLVIMVINIQVP